MSHNVYYVNFNKKDLIITDYCLSVDNCETIDKCLFIVCAECPF